MTDKKAGRHSFDAGDPRRIDLANADERAYWCKSLMTEEAELELAVAAVGDSAEAVRRWLGARRDGGK